ncbi:MAG: hypothetical protein JW969_17220 [Spirochaetales bacterium]|nr:hypothetical protein [Spirochaetales bacterium]
MDLILISFCVVDTLFLAGSGLTDPLIYLLMFVTAFVFFIALVVLKQGKFVWASNINIVMSFVAMNAGIWLSPTTQITELYKAGFFLSFVLIEACLIGYTLYQPLFLTIAGSIGIILVYIFIPPDPATTLDSSLNAMAPTLVLYAIAGAFACIIFNVMQKTVTIAEKESAENKRRFDELEAVVVTSKQGFRIGEQLLSFSEEIVKSVGEITGHLNSMKSEVENLSNGLQNSKDATDQINKAQESVKSNLSDQNSAVIETSSSMNEIISSIGNLSRVSQEKKNKMAELADMAKEGEDQINTSIQSIEEVARSSKSAMDLLKVIMNVSAKTNLLSMNAAIEAAHAEEFGKGFSVVASEIKKLAEETNQNTKVISGNIKKNLSDTEKAVDINKKVGDFFHEIIGGVSAIVVTLDEIITGLSELAGGSQEITHSTVHLKDITEDLNESLHVMGDFIANSSQVFGNIVNVFSQIRTEIEAIDGIASLISEKLSTFRELGRENISHIKMIDTEIERLKK